MIGRAVIYLDLKPASKVLHHRGRTLAPPVCTDERGHPERQAQAKKQARDRVGPLQWERVHEEEPRCFVKRQQQELITCSGRIGDPL